MGKNKQYLSFLLFTLLIIFSASCTKSNKSSTSSGTILKTIDIGGKIGILPGLLPGDITYNNVDDSIWVGASNFSSLTIGYVVKFDLKGNFITYTAVGHGAIDLTSDKQGNVWASVMNDNKLVELDSNGKIINQFNVGIRPIIINIDPTGNIWALNTGAPCITGTCFGPPYVSSFTEVSVAGSIISRFTFSTPFMGPFIFDQSNHIWIADDGATPQILEMDITGSTIKSFYGGPSVPLTWTFAGLTFDHNGDLWVADVNGNDADMVTKIYTTMNKQPESHTMGGKYPGNIAVDNNNNVWVTGYNSVIKMSNSGVVINTYRFDQFQQTFSACGTGAIIIDGNNNIWFSDDCGNGYVVKLAP